MMIRNTMEMKKDQRGFSLVEVVLALGLLGGVMISIAGLFVIAGRDMNAGKNTTEAMSIGRGILEEMEGVGYQQSWQVFGFDGSNVSETADSRTNAFAVDWQAELEEALFDAWAEIQIDSIVGTGGAPVLSSARAIRLTVTIHWAEGDRDREAILSTVRM